MNLRALSREQKLDCADYVNAALVDVRSIIETAPDAGPLLVAAYRALSVLGELRETIDSMPQVAEDSRA
jgi:hypothetical protein